MKAKPMWQSISIMSKHIHLSGQSLTPKMQWAAQVQFTIQRGFPPNIVIPETGCFYRSLG